MSPGKRVGYFGGTFDPPHLGHYILAVEALYQLELDALEWILTPAPPHKSDRQITPVEIRLEMLGLILAENPRFAISEVEIGRQPPHYAADTVEIIRASRPDDELIYIIGEDSLRDIPEWYQPQLFISRIDQLAVAPRPGVNTDRTDLDRILPGLAPRLVFLTDVMVEISSSLIRSRIKEGKPFAHFLPQAVADYLARHPVYR